jgi:tetratricopeptide (TPR) repeat protein
MTPDARRLPAWKLVVFANQFAERGAVPEALDLYRRAEEMGADDAILYSTLGRAFEKLTRLDDAIRCYRRALEINPSLHEAYNDMGNSLHASGLPQEAHAAYEAAIRLAPRNGPYYRNYVQAKRLKAGDPLFAVMERLVQDTAGTPPDDRLHLHFALGLALTEAGEPTPGFRHLLQANAQHRARVAYDEAATFERLAATRRVFTREQLERRAGAGDPSPTPIFIIGMPRSGSTLVEQILASHPQVVGGGERPDFSLTLKEAVEALGTASAGDAPAPPAADAAPQSEIDALTPERLRAIGAAYLARLGQATQGRTSWQRITDKMLFNFELLGLIHLALPNARFVHTRRAPVETCLSCFARLFKDVPFCYDLGELGRYYREYHAMIEHWRAVLPPGVLLDVQYEDVVDDVEREARRVIAHCGLEWDDACLDFHATRRPVVTASAAQVRQPIYRSSLVYSRPDAALIAPLIDALGPELAG